MEKLIVCFILLVSCIFFGSLHCRIVDKWTWSYKKVFTDGSMLANGEKKEILFFKKDIKKFSQLIFSWCALRPEKGYFSFYVKTRNSFNKRWGKWHKMMDWGANVQKSYFSKDGNTKYFYVRLETGLANLSDAFSIKVKCNEGASLGFLESICVNASDFSKFKPEIIDDNLLSLKNVYVKNVPKISQRVLDHPHTSKICSPTSCSMLASYFNRKIIDGVDFADRVFDNGLGIYGSWPFNVAELYNECNGKVLFYLERMNSFYDLHLKLKSAIPVVVSVRGKIEGASKTYRDGHLMLVIGWDSKRKKVICHDPAFFSNKSTFVSYKIEDFLIAWEKSNRLVYVAEDKRRKNG